VSAEYSFRVRGRLTPGVVGALDPLRVVATETETLLVGRPLDAAALHGLIAHIEALGLDLVALQRIPARPVRNQRSRRTGTDRTARRLRT
jgi:hypothetical protein